MKPSKVETEAFEAWQSLIKVTDAVIAERTRQDAKWGEQNHPSVPHDACASLGLPVEMYAKILNEDAVDAGALTWGHIALEEFVEAVCARDETHRREELVQLAAVCVAWIQCIDRREDQRQCLC